MQAYPRFLKPYEQIAHVGPAAPKGSRYLEGQQMLASTYGGAIEYLWTEVERSRLHGNDVLQAFWDRRNVGGEGQANSTARSIVEEAVVRCKADPKMLEALFADQVDRVPGSKYGLFILESLPRKNADRYVSVPDAATAAYLTAAIAEYGSAHILSKLLCPFDVGIYEISQEGRKKPYHPMVWSGRDTLSLPEKLVAELARSGVELHPEMTVQEIARRTRTLVTTPKLGLRARISRSL